MSLFLGWNKKSGTMKRFLLPVLLVCAFCVQLASQTTYRVQIGTFIDAQIENFRSLQSYGFVYAEEQAGNYQTVYLGGGIPTSQAAGELAQRARNLGYNNAIPQTEPKAGSITYTVQFASLSAIGGVDWSKYVDLGELHFSVQGNVVKLMVGNYPSPNAASLELRKIKSAGYADAFVQQIDRAALHKAGKFELGNTKRPLIPIPQNGATTRGGGEAPFGTQPTPDNRSDVKRNSTLELQKALTEEGYYAGTLDGFYGTVTRDAFQRFLRENRDIQERAAEARSLDFSVRVGPNDEIQYAINNLNADPYRSGSILERSSMPIAFAYRAYYLMNMQGPSTRVNSLMQEALRAAYSGKPEAGSLPMDLNRNYNYQNLTQVIHHLYFVQAAPGYEYAAPCWLFLNHSQESQAARQGFNDYAQDNFKVENCDGFTDWEEVRYMVALAEDIGNRNIRNDPQLLALNASRRSKLYFLSGSLQSPELGQQAENWFSTVGKGLTQWAAQSARNKRLLQAFKITFIQCLIHFEDYFMDKGYSPQEARSLGIVTLLTLTNYPLEPFY